MDAVDVIFGISCWPQFSFNWFSTRFDVMANIFIWVKNTLNKQKHTIIQWTFKCAMISISFFLFVCFFNAVSHSSRWSNSAIYLIEIEYCANETNWTHIEFEMSEKKKGKLVPHLVIINSYYIVSAIIISIKFIRNWINCFFFVTDCYCVIDDFNWELYEAYEKKVKKKTD